MKLPLIYWPSGRHYPKISICGSHCSPCITSSPIHQPGSLSKPALSPLEREQDEGHGSTSEGKEDRLEKWVPPYIPALTFVVMWHCSYHQPTLLYSFLLLKGGIMGSSNLHAPPLFHSNREWSISSFT